MPSARTVVGAAAAHATRISPVSGSMNGSPSVRKISLTPSLALDRDPLHPPDAKRPPRCSGARSEHSNSRSSSCSRNWCKATGASRRAGLRQPRQALPRNAAPNMCGPPRPRIDQTVAGEPTLYLKFEPILGAKLVTATRSPLRLRRSKAMKSGNRPGANVLLPASSLNIGPFERGIMR